jgi:hypothetical protein
MEEEDGYEVNDEEETNLPKAHTQIFRLAVERFHKAYNVIIANESM